MLYCCVVLHVYSCLCLMVVGVYMFNSLGFEFGCLLTCYYFVSS